MKKCFKCNLVKNLSEFYRHPKMQDGYLGKCRECTKKDVKENALKNSEKIRASRHDYYMRHRKQNCRYKPKKTYSIFKKELAKKLYYEGLRVQEISKQLNVNSRTIYDWLDETLPKTGVRAANWKGGINPINLKIRKSEEMNEWRFQVFQRDNFSCVSCGQVGKKLEAHHILPFAKYQDQRFNVDNGVTLCVKCHNKLHSKRKAAVET